VLSVVLAVVVLVVVLLLALQLLASLSCEQRLSIELFRSRRLEVVWWGPATPRGLVVKGWLGWALAGGRCEASLPHRCRRCCCLIAAAAAAAAPAASSLVPRL
jgi:hypothetical protein